MDIGKLDRLIRIEEKSVTRNPDYGTEIVSWVELATVFASVQDVLPSRAESNQGQIRIENSPARVRTRYMEGISSDMRIVMLDRGNRIMQIVSGPAELGRKEGLEFMVENYTTAGGAP